MSPTPPLKRGTLTSSIKTLTLHQTRRQASGLPIQIDQAIVGHPTQLIIRPEQFHLLHIDPKYQRDEKPAEINQLIHVLKSGGYIPDPIRIVKRPDGTYWIIDGQQRFEAHRRCQVEFSALVYTFADVHQEAKLFLVLNRRVQVSSDGVVQAWQGASGMLLRQHAARSGSPYFAHVNFGKNDERSRPYSAALLARSLCMALTPRVSRATGATQAMLEKLDMLLTEPGADERTEAFLRLIPLVFPPTLRTFRFLPALSVGAVAQARWDHAIVFPGPTVYNRIAKIEWNKLAPSHALRFLPVLKAEIERFWK